MRNEVMFDGIMRPFANITCVDFVLQNYLQIPDLTWDLVKKSMMKI
uniref:Uncharacterized protein n=1 Tax=Anguilla anguilla TaxID=7936 RepID=A0A0E9RJS1_ANGAN